MTTLTKYFEIYKMTPQLHRSRVILCNWKTQEGIEFYSVEEFQKFMADVKYDEYYILNETSNEEIVVLEYFKLTKATPSVIAIKHPLMTNAYWKDIPDKIIDISISEGIYRYALVDYGKKLKEYIIELPSTIDSNVLNYCRELMPKFFRIKPSGNQNVSLLFTNTNRYEDLDKTNFVTYNLKELYPEWDIKTVTPANLSRKVWDGIKDVLKTSKAGLFEE